MVYDCSDQIENLYVPLEERIFGSRQIQRTYVEHMAVPPNMTCT